MALLTPSVIPIVALDVPDRAGAEAVVQGDRKVPAISAASILAKVARDRWCLEIDAEYPAYGFAAHKGYGTAQHLLALQTHGATPWHRRSFSPVARVLSRGPQ